MCEYKYTGQGEEETDARCYDRHWDRDEHYEDDTYKDSSFIL